MTLSNILVLAPRRACWPPRADFLLKRQSSVDATRHRHQISTLDPHLLTAADYTDLSGKRWHNPELLALRGAFLQSVGPVRLKAKPRVPTICYARVGPRVLAFPHTTQGFMYYHPGPRATPLGGSIRFRITPDRTPHSFRDGSDLLLPCGLPWRILLPQILCRQGYARFGPQLVQDGLVTDDQVSQCWKLFHDNGRICPGHTIFGLDSTFPVDFTCDIGLTIVGSQLHRIQLSPFKGRIDRGEKWFSSWKGSAIARFEPSTLPEYAGRRVLHLQFIKIIEPAIKTMVRDTASDRILPPEDGQLFTISPYRQAPRPWAYDIDGNNSNTAAGLRVLWDQSSTSAAYD
ncbi:hypothetical protein B0H15DRAFT_952346 [Mycena belliarum]|uniref:Uncharacterized protein n=1 Tax=Mycena belliarum TaxID=1033014 RepID=A0AAD6TX23_9AGAR|nr:hypothetical protein B0H15DRAFT_952346 [Mycena belliae]